MKCKTLFSICQNWEKVMCYNSITRFLIAFLFLLTGQYSFAQKPIQLNQESVIYKIDQYTLYEDQSNQLQFKDILTSTLKPSDKSNLNIGLSHSTFWLKFKIENNTSDPSLLLDLRHPTLDIVELYTYYPDKEEIISQEISEYKVFAERKHKHPNCLFDIYVPKSSSVICFLKIKSNEQINLPVYTGTSETILKSLMDRDLIIGMYMGIILVMLLYNLFVYITVNDRIYLYYVVYILFVGLAQLSLHNYTFKMFWPEIPWLSRYSAFLLPSLASISAIIFMKSFLKTKVDSKKINSVLNIIIGLFILSALLPLFKLYHFGYQGVQLSTAIISFFGLYIGFYRLRKGFKPAKYFIVGWSALLVGAFMYVLKDIGLLPYNFITINSMQIGSAMEVVLLSFALADRINILKEEKQVAQAQELKQRIEKETILKDQAKNLKLKIDIATEELKTKNHKLNIAYRQVEAAKAELIQKEKITALGQMAAGMAHEFNNNNTNIKLALGVIELNTSYYKKYIDFLHNILPKAKNIDKQFTDLKNYKKEIQYKSIAEDLNGSFKRANNGLEKIALSTKKLQDFSKIDSKGWISTDINRDLNNLHDLWKSNLGAINVKLNLTNNLKQLIINAQALNDCFKSLLQNSIEAIKEKDMPEKEGLITINTSLINGHAVISFSDNGVGMSKEVEQKAFDFYFTTKGALKNGINLSIVQSTVAAHDGHIELDTKPGEGTTIRLIIPLTGKKHDKKK